MKTKTTQTILTGPHSLKEHIKRAMIDPSRAGWLRDETNWLKPFWYECIQLPTSMKGKEKITSKGKRRRFS